MTNTEQIIVQNWWKSRTALERGLLIMSMSCLLMAVGLFVGIEIVATKYRSCDRQLLELNDTRLRTAIKGSKIVGKDLICMSPECIHTASVILSNMDQEADPCENFYEFVCGNFVKNTIIPDDQTSVDTFSMIDDDLQMELRASIEETIKDEESRPFKLIKTLYQNCMDKALVEEEGLKPLNKIIDKLGGWPVLIEDYDDDAFDWQKSVFTNRRLGYSVDYFISFDIDIDQKNSSRRMISLDQAWLSLPREYLSKGLENEVVDAYYNYMIDIAIILGADKDRAIEDMLKSLNFEILLANISVPSEKRRNATNLYNPMTVAELTEAYPTIPWLDFMNELLDPILKIDSNEIINVKEPSFIKSMMQLLATTPRHVLANYAVWRVVRDSIDYLDDDIRKRQLEYWSEITGETEREPRWQECVGVVSSSMSLGVGAMYVRKYFDEKAKNNVVEMVSGIRKEFRKIIEKVDWMDDETRNAALEKIDAMNSFIAYPNELLDDKKLEDYYAMLDIQPGHYFDSVLNLTLFTYKRTIEQLRLPVNKSDWIMYGESAVVNAYYSPNDNSMQFPAGILQGEFFDKNRPQYMNYGAIGFVMGHEITHGFDDQGRQYDKDGNLVDWWQEKTKKKFLQKAQCIINQYGNYTDKTVGLSLNGVNTQGENIADNGGLKEAYLAYNEWVKQNGEEALLPGLDYTPRQMFWISAATVWCTKQRSEMLKLDIVSDEHSPGEFRVVGPMSNMPEFAEDFKCPLGSKMNPKKKCNVW